MKIFTHMNPDLDAYSSVWAAKKFIPGAQNAEVEFRHANWDGREMTKWDLALDMEAGGRGVKGKKEENGTVHSCFASIVADYATPEDQEALWPIIAFIDAQDAYGSAFKHFVPGMSNEIRLIFGTTGLNAILRALQSVNKEPWLVLDRFSDILDGFLKAGKARMRAKIEADKTEVLGGKVALLVNPRESGTADVLFEERGVQVLVYANGKDLGLTRNNDVSLVSLRMDHPDIRAVVEEVGEQDEWFAHSAGFLFCRGSRKAPAPSRSKVDPRKLAEVAAQLLGG